MVRTYRNPKRNRIVLGEAVGGLFSIVIAGFVLLDVVADSPLTLLFTLPLFLGFTAVIYAVCFRRVYEIRLSDEGDCEFQAAVSRKHLRAQEITSVELNAGRTWSSGDNDVDHTIVRFQGGKLGLVIVQPVDGFDEFLDRLQALNRTIDVRGAEPVTSGPKHA
jgi:hypothetical protein